MTDPSRGEVYAPFSSHVREYLDAGWQGPFPLPFAQKQPPPDGVTGRSGKMPDEDQIDEWLSGPTANGNIALRLPGTVVGIDVDHYGDKTGAETLAKAEEVWGPLPATYRSSARPSPSGIRFYRVPANTRLRWPASVNNGAGIDVIQYSHRYAVVYPSAHKDMSLAAGSVVKYHWYDCEGNRTAAIPRVDELPELPDTWLQALKIGTVEAMDVSDVAVKNFYASLIDGDGQMCLRVRQAAYRYRGMFMGQTWEGSRHDAGLRAVHDLQHLGAECHSGVVTALNMVHQAYLAAKTGFDPVWTEQDAESEWRRIVDGPTGVGDVYAKIAKGAIQIPESGVCDCAEHEQRTISAADAFMGEPGVVAEPASSDEAPFDGEGELSRAEWLRGQQFYKELFFKKEISAQVEKDYRSLIIGSSVEEADLDEYDLSDLLDAELGEEPFLVENIWPKDSSLLLAAINKAGKTTATMNVVRTLVDGEPLFGRFARPQELSGNVYVYDNEMTKLQIQDLYCRGGVRNTRQVKFGFYKGLNHKFNITDDDVFAWWVDHLRSLDTEVLIIDNLYAILKALGLSENNEIGYFTTPLDRLVAEAGISELLLVHHTGWDGTRVRGDSGLEGWAGSKAYYTMDADKNRFLEVTGRAGAHLDKTKVDVDRETQILTLNDSGPAAVKRSETEGKVVRVLVDNPGCIQAKLIYLLSGSVGEKTVRRIVQTLKTRGELREEPNPENPKSSYLYYDGDPWFDEPQGGVE